MPKGITSTEGLIRVVFKLDRPDDRVLFYRGHSRQDTYKLEPSLFRTEALLQAEPVMFRELLVSNPGDFRDDKTTLDRLVRMQHHSLPTRLLDLTSNPLIALYFACKGLHPERGAVIVLSVLKERIKFFDSDTASIIANLARLSQADKEELDLALDVAAFNESQPVQKLLHFIREEKPNFLQEIDPADVGRIVAVKTKRSNRRIVSQSGAFLLFGHDTALGEDGNDDVSVATISVNPHEKEKILRELDELNINESTVFPYLENSAKYVATKYS